MIPTQSPDQTDQKTQKNAKTKTESKVIKINKAKLKSRVIIDQLKPAIEDGRYAIKRVPDEWVEVSATLLIDGHEKLKGDLLYRLLGANTWTRIPLEDKGNDTWQARFQIVDDRDYEYTVEACIDRFGTWSYDYRKRINAKQANAVDWEIGLELLKQHQKQLKQNEDKTLLNQKLTQAPIMKLEEFEQWNDEPAFQQLLVKLWDKKSLVSYPQVLRVRVEPTLANFSAWYEFFPRSFGDKPGEHGNFKSCQPMLEHAAKMGFDIVYLPPIHPIGSAFKKGKNNSLKASAEDVGSPWAIGSKDGGHKSIHPKLGTLADFKQFVEKAQSFGLKIAMDLAFQCSPDHPYVKEHPEWFKQRPDGTIQYAENPPKKYQDIYPFDFECEDHVELWNELYSVVTFWIEQGIKVFRVDNPHTKPFHFWDWLMAKVRQEHPDVIFLAEAFTRPAMMYYLAKVGFHQSYTYFTWRNTKEEFTQYLKELTQTELREYFRPNFWPNTPDILPERLHHANRPAFVQRLILAATMSSNYGIYGPAYELLDHIPRELGSEEYQDSEKYELKQWNLKATQSLAPIIKKLNLIRKSVQAFHYNHTLNFETVDNPHLIAFTKHDENDQWVLVVINLDENHKQSGMVHLSLDKIGIANDQSFQVHDLLTDARFHWQGWNNYVELDPHMVPAHIFLIRKKIRTESEFEYFT